MKKLTIILVILVIFIVYLVVSNKCDNIIYETYKSDTEGPTVLIVGSVHGNEPAGSLGSKAISNLLNSGKLKIKRGNLILVTEANPCGLKLGVRGVPHRILSSTYDINRNFRKADNLAYKEGGNCPISKQIASLAKESDLVLDLHEAWGWYKENKGSMGSGIFYRYPGSKQIAETIKEEINKTIKDDIKKFIATENWSQINTALEASPFVEDKPYILIEVSGQNNIQDINVRKNQMEIAIITLLKKLEMV